MAEESARDAILCRTWCRARSRFSSKALLADVSEVRIGEVAERTAEDFVALIDRTLVSLNRTGVNGFTLRIGAGI